MKTCRYAFTVVSGYGVASGRAADSPYPDGTIALQKPFFSALGLDLSACYNGTINAAFDCRQVMLKRWHYQFFRVNWHAGLAAEDFRFVSCKLICKHPESVKSYPAYIYQVVADSKLGHFQDANVLELLAPEVRGLAYGDEMAIELEENILEFT